MWLSRMYVNIIPRLTAKICFSSRGIQLWIFLTSRCPGLYFPTLPVSETAESGRVPARRDSHFTHKKKQKSMADGILSVSQSFVQSKKHYETVTESCSVYKRRWYILTIFSLIAGVQAAAWNTWGPITGSAEDVFGWSDGTIALLENWGPIAYIVSFLFFSWLMDVKGMLVYLWGRNTELWWCIISIKRAIPWRASVRFTCSDPSASSLECTICTV